MEIEKKFTLKYLPENLEKYEYKDIIQGYVSRKPVIRIRKSNNNYYLTLKIKQNGGKSGAIVNIENEYEIAEEEFTSLLEKCDGNLIKKRRYLIPLPDKCIKGYDDKISLVAELDIFSGALEGLIFAEVEFPDETAAECFVKPAWMEKDVSNDVRYTNSYLSTKKSLEELLM